MGSYFLQHIPQTIRLCRRVVAANGTSKKRIRRDPTKRESKWFQSTWVERRMQAAEKVVEMGGEVAVAMEALVEALWLPCLTRHRRLGHVKTSSAISSPSALETRARMETCSEPQRTRWPHTLGPSLATMRLKSGHARSKSHSMSQSTPNPFWIGMTRGTKLHLRSPAKIGEDNHWWWN